MQSLSRNWVVNSISGPHAGFTLRTPLQKLPVPLNPDAMAIRRSRSRNNLESNLTVNTREADVAAAVAVDKFGVVARPD
jgi:hypothetical protein